MCKLVFICTTKFSAVSVSNNNNNNNKNNINNNFNGRLRGLAIACWITDHYHACSNPGVGISEGCFIFRFVSLPLEVARPI